MRYHFYESQLYTSPSASRTLLIISQTSESWFMSKHKLYELNTIIEERITSIKEEVEIANNMRSNPVYVIDLKDEIVSLRWVTRIIKWVLDRAFDGGQHLGITKMRSELEDTKKFENMLHDKIQELEIELEDSSTAREKEVLVNEVNTLKCVLGHLFNLKPVGDEIRALGIAEAINDYQRANRLRKKLIKMQDTESEISAQIQSQRETESAKSYKYLSNANLNLADLGNSLFDSKSLNSLVSVSIQIKCISLIQI